MKRAKIVFLCTLFWIFWACGTDLPEKDMLARKAFFEMQRKLENDTLISEADMLYFGKICARFGDSIMPFDSFKHPRIWVENGISFPPVGGLQYRLKTSQKTPISFRDEQTDNFYELDSALSTNALLVYAPQPVRAGFEMRTLAPEKGDSLRMVLAYLYYRKGRFFGQTPKGDWKLLTHFTHFGDQYGDSEINWAFDAQGRFEYNTWKGGDEYCGNILLAPNDNFTYHHRFYSDTVIKISPAKFERSIEDYDTFFEPFEGYGLYEAGDIISHRADTVFYLHTLAHRLYARNLVNDSLVENIEPIWSDTIRSVWVWDAKARNHTLRSAKSSQKLLTDKEVWQITSNSEELDLYLYELPIKNPNLYARIFKNSSPKQQKTLKLLQKRCRTAKP